MASRNFAGLASHQANARINFATGAFKFMLVSAIPDETAFDTWDYRNDVNIEVAAGGGYSTGGVAVVPTIGSFDTTLHRLPIVFADLLPMLNGTKSAVGGIIYLSTGNAATDCLLQFVDFGGTVSCTNNDYNVEFDTPIYINI